MIVYYNPDCSKCAQALNLLEESNCSFELRNYLQDPPTKEELQQLVGKLGCSAIDIVRKKETLFLENYSDKNYTDSEWIDVLIKHPLLIERPIVIDDERAVIGRPPELILDLIKK